MKRILSNIIKILYPVAVYLIITFGIALIIRALGLKLEVRHVILILILEQAVSIAAIYFIYRFQSKASRLEIYNGRFSDFGLKNMILIFAATYFVLMSISLLSVVLHLHESFPGYSEVVKIITSGPVLLQFVSAVILAPVLEEVLCRGIIFNRMREISNFYISALVSSLIWSAAHMNVVQGFTALLYGIFLAFLYEKFKTLWVPILSHGFFNLIAVVSGYIAALPENGQVLKEPVIDPSAALAAFTINFLISAWLILLLYRSKFPHPR